MSLKPLDAEPGLNLCILWRKGAGAYVLNLFCKQIQNWDVLKLLLLCLVTAPCLAKAEHLAQDVCSQDCVQKDSADVENEV